MRKLFLPPKALPMKGILILAALLWANLAFGQVDVEPRRTAQFQMGFPTTKGDERVYPLGYVWFNRNNFPWDGTALRVIYGGLLVDAEMSRFLSADNKTVVGGGVGGGSLVDMITPYLNGEPLSDQEFNVASLGARVFIEREMGRLHIADKGDLPLNLRFTYSYTRNDFTGTRSTSGFQIPPEFATSSLLGEFRLGGIEPGLASDRGLELYAATEAGLRSGFHAFGPEANPYPEESRYRTALLSVAAIFPIADEVVSARLAAGRGEGVDELSAWKIGGNCVGFEPYIFPLHGYFTQQFLAQDFEILNLFWNHWLLDNHRLAFHLYADRAELHLVPPNLTRWYDRSGVGAGIGIQAPGDFTLELNYGYAINPNPGMHEGNQELAVALEKSF